MFDLTARAAAFTLVLAASSPALAQGGLDPNGLDDVLEGFDAPAQPTSQSGGDDLDNILGGFDDAISPPSAAEPGASDTALPSPWTLSGSVSVSAAYDYTQNAPATGEYDKRGLSRTRAKAALKLKGDLPDQFAAPLRVLGEVTAAHDFIYALRGRGDYNATITNSFERDVNLGELYASAELDRGIELTLGRQIVVWGTSESLRVVDVVNPLDRRELGMVDIEDLRLALTMARADYVTGPWTATALVIPHIRFNKLPPAYSPYDTQNGQAAQQDVPDDGLGNAEFAASLRGNFSGWDMSLHAANVFDDGGHKQTVNGETRIRHERLTLLGVTGNVALGNWLLKGESAHLDGLETQGVANTDFRRTDVLLGLEYSGLTDTTVSFEAVNRHLHDWSRALIPEGLKQNSQEYALRFSGDYLREKLHVTVLTTRISPLTKGGGYSRATVEYDIRDALSVTGGVTLYHDGTRAPFKGNGDNDRIFIELKQSF